MDKNASAHLEENIFIHTFEENASNPKKQNAMKPFSIRSLFFAVALLTASCSGGAEKAGGSDEMTATTPVETEEFVEQDMAKSEAPVLEDQTSEPGEPTTSNDPTIPVEKKIIKTGDINMTVENCQETRKQLDSLIAKYAAYVGNENESKSGGAPTFYMVLRVPSANFEPLVQEVVSLAKTLNSKNIQATDVTEEFVDIQARLKNKREVEKSYQELLKKAYTISDILEVEQHLRMIREEIEAKEGRLKYLESQVGYSTLTLNFSEQYEAIYDSFGGQVLEALESGWKGFLGFLVGVLYLWPLWLIAGAVFYFVRKSIKRRRAKKAQQAATSATPK